MIVAILLVLCVISVECRAIRNEIVELRLPIALEHRSQLTVNGTMDLNRTLLRMKIVAKDDVNNIDEKDDKYKTSKDVCLIEIKPKEELVSIKGFPSEYSFFKTDKSIVPFTFTARATVNKEYEMHLLHLEFSANAAGPLSLEEPCSFNHISEVDKVIFEGFSSITRVIFENNEDDTD